MSYTILNPIKDKKLGKLIISSRDSITYNIIEMNEWDKEQEATYRLASYFLDKYIKNSEGDTIQNPNYHTFLVKKMPFTKFTFQLMDENEKWSIEKVYAQEIVIYEQPLIFS